MKAKYPDGEELILHTFDDWWKRPDPSAFVPVHGDDAFWSVMDGLGGSLLITAKQQGRMAILSASATGGMASVVSVSGAMGAATNGTALAVGTSDGVRVYQNVNDPLASEATFVPASFHFTGFTSIHEVGWDATGQLWFVNTRFSTLCTVDPMVQFAVRWRPFFVDKLCDGDSCHLNGLAMFEGHPAYVTALGETGTPGGWRKYAPDGGIVMSIDQNIIRRGLRLPHSPIATEDSVFLLESGCGRLLRLSRNGDDEVEICRLHGLARGLVRGPSHWFVGLSKVRDSSGEVAVTLKQTMGDIDTARIVAIDTDTGMTVGEAKLPFLNEISSITLLPFKSARIAEPTAIDLDRSWLYSIGGC